MAQKLTDYIFSELFHCSKSYLRVNEKYVVLMDIGDLRKGDVVEFIGFSDVDNHFGVFVFADAKGSILEYSGDFSGPSDEFSKKIHTALSKPSYSSETNQT